MAKKAKTYENIERPYDSFLKREKGMSYQLGEEVPVANSGNTGMSGQSGGGGGDGGAVEQKQVKSGQGVDDLWISSFIRSENWQPKVQGFYIDGRTGYAEFSNVFISGSLVLNTSSSISGGQLDYNEGTGFFLGYSGGAYKFSVGVGGTGPALLWDGTTLVSNGVNINTPGSSTDISLLDYTHNITFSSTDENTVAWTTGTIRFSNNTTSTVAAGNTGDMATGGGYIYFNSASPTVLAYTPIATPSNASGPTKIVLAKAAPGATGSGEAVFQVFGGLGGLKIGSSALNIANNNWTYSGTFTAIDADTVDWSNGGILKVSNGTQYTIANGTTFNMTAKTYIYFDISQPTKFLYTQSAQTAVGDGKILIAVAENVTTGNKATFFVMNEKQASIAGSQLIDGTLPNTKIVAGSISATEIAAGAITAGKIAAGGVVAGNLAAGSVVANSIAAGQIDGGHIGATSLGALKATLGTVTSGTITSTTITGGTVRTSAGTERVEMTEANNRLDIYSNNVRRMSLDRDSLEFYNSSGEKTAFITTSSYSIVIDASATTYESRFKFNSMNGLWFYAGASTQICGITNSGIQLQAGYDLIAQSSSCDVGSSGTPFGNVYCNTLRTNQITGSPVNFSADINVGGTVKAARVESAEFDGVTDFNGQVDFLGSSVNLYGLLSVTTFDGVVGDFWAISTGSDLGTSSKRWGTVYCVATNVSSDETLKKSVKDLDNAEYLEKIKETRTIEYELIDEPDTEGKKYLGFSAQQLLTLMPETVTGEKEGEYGINTTSILGALTAAVKELTAKVERLEAQLAKKDLM